MMNSLVWKGKVHDYHFKKLGDDNWHVAFYCGNIFMGQIFRMSNGRHTSWTAVPKVPTNLGPFDGFRTRFDACEMILKVNGYRINSWGKPHGPSHNSATVEAICELIDKFGKCSAKMGIANFGTLKRQIMDLIFTPAFRYLKKGDIIQAGDEYEERAGVWIESNCIGEEAPDPRFTSHRQYRRFNYGTPPV
jgi:hypothetical protein